MQKEMSIKRVMTNMAIDQIKAKIHLDFDHLLHRLRNSDTEEKYIEALQDFASIPAFTLSDNYKSFYELLCTYNEILTRKKLIEQYMDECIEIVDEMLNENQIKTRWKKTKQAQ